MTLGPHTDDHSRQRRQGGDLHNFLASVGPPRLLNAGKRIGMAELSAPPSTATDAPPYAHRAACKTCNSGSNIVVSPRCVLTTAAKAATSSLNRKMCLVSSLFMRKF